jgi:actin-related protein 6
MQQPTVDYRIVVIDNGGGSCKVGFAGELTPRIVPNVIAKTKGTSVNPKGQVYVGDQIDTECDNYSSLIYKRPMEKGYIVDCETQIAIWNRIFSEQVLNVADFTDRHIFLTHQPFTPNVIKSDMAQMVFEHFGFNDYTSISGAYCAFNGFMNEDQAQGSSIYHSHSAVVVDSGFSFSNVVPIVNHTIPIESIRRVDIGGKALTNYLKEIVSLRYYDMMDETHVMNMVKEKTCFVSLDFKQDMDIVRNPDNELQRRYVLPDYRESKTGFIKKKGDPVLADEQILVMNNERITVPELLFTPSDIGLNQAGISEAIVQAVSSTREYVQNVLYDCVLLVGGNTIFENYKERLERDLRCLAPFDQNVTVYQPKDPITCSWKGASILAGNNQARTNILSNLTVSKKEYDEHGANICIKKFYF